MMEIMCESTLISSWTALLEHGVESLDMTDYIILDFRCTRPQESHDGKLSFLQLGTNLTSDII